MLNERTSLPDERNSLSETQKKTGKSKKYGVLASLLLFGALAGVYVPQLLGVANAYWQPVFERRNDYGWPQTCAREARLTLGPLKKSNTLCYGDLTFDQTLEIRSGGFSLEQVIIRADDTNSITSIERISPPIYSPGSILDDYRFLREREQDPQFWDYYHQVFNETSAPLAKTLKGHFEIK